jgi:hypothetical protein
MSRLSKGALVAGALAATAYGAYRLALMMRELHQLRKALEKEKRSRADER